MKSEHYFSTDNFDGHLNLTQGLPEKQFLIEIEKVLTEKFKSDNSRFEYNGVDDIDGEDCYIFECSDGDTYNVEIEENKV